MTPLADGANVPTVAGCASAHPVDRALAGRRPEDAAVARETPRDVAPAAAMPATLEAADEAALTAEKAGAIEMTAGGTRVSPTSCTTLAGAALLSEYWPTSTIR